MASVSLTMHMICLCGLDGMSTRLEEFSNIWSKWVSGRCIFGGGKELGTMLEGTLVGLSCCGEEWIGFEG